MANKKTAPAPVATTNSAPPVPPKASKSGNAPFVKYYLLAYNVLSTLGWGYVLVLTLVHLFNLDGRASVLGKPVVIAAPSAFSRFMSSIPFFKSPPPSPATITIQSRLPAFLQPIYTRSITTYTRVGNTVAVVQTFALLEVAHVLLGWVRSPLQTTAMQVASRLWIVWGIVQQFGVARANPLYTSCVLAWSITEVVRYSFYASNLLGQEPPVLLYLRYTLFYVLYPIGAGSEAFLSYATLPIPSGVPSVQSFLGWSVGEYVRLALFITWWPALYQLYTYMIKQRRKIYGAQKKVKTN
ncbi:FCP1-like proteiny domain-containing protein [Mycena indigotica]|uniref:Very-long-chain (3R)-3-hydroxyacyl-CoA dehydratase n=1 Tax=Mycena indigotica TaxID=2126181 RepID=A0A8H6TDF0_9AGAR|nr:FCP1-like proteiny domain-containing protein [Mycena indigotica]KAF7315381.1 FCP1-like proteiny domain-containing protein [Mycena indigotica]